MASAIRHARNGDVHIAYRVLGEGPVDLVWVPGWISNVEWFDDTSPPFWSEIHRLAGSVRVIGWDKRGTGQSDPVSGVPTLEERVGDMLAVLDAAGSERAVLMGASEGGPMSILFAATHPDRVSGLVLLGTAPRFTEEPPDYPWGWTKAEVAAQLDDIDERWGAGALAHLFYPSLGELGEQLWGQQQRQGSSPGMAKLLWRALCELDVRDVLPAVAAPALVLCRPGDPIAPAESMAVLAERMPNAEYRELPPGDHIGWDVAATVVDEILRFVGAEAKPSGGERVLATLLFTDIVGSTERAAAVGDPAWRRLLDAHDLAVRRIVADHGGTLVKQTGDGAMAVFDGPTQGVRCALALSSAMERQAVPIRAGVHTGECERRGEDYGGIGVHIAARVAGLAGAGEVLASRTVKDLSFGSPLAFEDLGEHDLKGVPQPWQVFRVTAATAPT